MFRPASRAILRTAQSSLAPARTIAGRRFITTEPPHLRGRSWKSSAARWGIAVAGIYYYNTSPVFAEQPHNNLLNPAVEATEEDSASIQDLVSRRSKDAEKNRQALSSATDSRSSTTMPVSTDPTDPHTQSDPASLEAEAEQQGAFNEETGEINWDCPCLGGMAYGPCGPEFREAFSCFVFSKEEPKGMDCIEKFKGMQECFQQHPEVYKGELEEDAELEAAVEKEREELKQQIATRDAADHSGQQPSQRRLLEESTVAAPPSSPPADSKPAHITSQHPPAAEAKVPASSEPHPGMSEEHEAMNEGPKSSPTRRPNPPPVKDKFDQDLDLMPKDWHDARTGGSAGKETEK